MRLVYCEMSSELCGSQGVVDRVPDELPGRSRYRRARILTAALAHHGRTGSDPGSRPHYLITDRKSAATVAAGVPALWRRDEVPS
jgi:hypothetical protein